MKPSRRWTAHPPVFRQNSGMLHSKNENCQKTALRKLISFPRGGFFDRVQAR